MQDDISNVKIDLNKKDHTAQKDDVIYVPLSPLEVNSIVFACQEQLRPGCKTCGGKNKKWIPYVEYFKKISEHWRKKHDNEIGK